MPIAKLVYFSKNQIIEYGKNIYNYKIIMIMTTKDIQLVQMVIILIKLKQNILKSINCKDGQYTLVVILLKYTIF